MIAPLSFMNNGITIILPHEHVFLSVEYTCRSEIPDNMVNKFNENILQ